MMGTLMHEWLEQALVSENPDCDVTLESTVEDDHRIGHIDVLITRGAELTVLDIKTATHNSVKKILENPPKPYLYQAATYADMRGADGAELLILDKDTLERIVVPVPQEAFDGAREEWEALIACWERGETPPSTDEERECLYCPWKERCGKGELPGTITQQKEG
jgi:RecB family exonuclease